MNARPVVLRVAGSLAALVLLAGCGQVRPAEGGEPLEPGWNEIPAAPYSPELAGTVAFWTGDELVVSGGYELPPPFEQVTFRTETYAYSLESGQWRELEPISVPGFDGALSFSGTWTGTAWIGVALPCRNGDVVDEDPSTYCDRVPIGLQWTSEAGWVTGDPVPPESAGAESNVVSVAGMTSSSLILTTVTGFLFRDIGAGADAPWSFAPWPSGVEPLQASSACVIDEQILTVSTVLDLGGDPLDPGESANTRPQTLTANTLNLGGEVLGQRSLSSVPFLPFEPYCQQGRAVFVYTNPGQPILRVNAEEVVPLPLDTEGSIDEPPISVSDEWIDVGTGIVSLAPAPGGFYVDHESGEATPLQPVPIMNVNVWTGELLFTRQNGSPRWFAFLPRETWQNSSDLEFPFQTDGD